VFKPSVHPAPSVIFFSSDANQLFLGIHRTFLYLFKHWNHIPVFPILFPSAL
jgi:hypothetical protein